MTIRFQQLSEPVVVRENTDFLVVSKPAGWHCAASRERAAELSLSNWMAARYPELRRVRGFADQEFGLLHRLDAATSGLVLFARNDTAFDCLRAAAAAGRFVKQYRLVACTSGSGLAGSRPLMQAAAAGSLEQWQRRLRRNDAAYLAGTISGIVVESVFRAYGPGRRQVACADPALVNGKSAARWGADVYHTHIVDAGASQEIAVHSDGSVSLAAVPSVILPPTGQASLVCRVRLTRGFRHQIRAHFAWLGLPLLGGRLYGESDQEDRQPRLCLHADALVFPSPRNDHSVEVQDPDSGASPA